VAELRSLVPVLGDHLELESSAFDGSGAEVDAVRMAEVAGESTHVVSSRPQRSAAARWVWWLMDESHRPALAGAPALPPPPAAARCDSFSQCWAHASCGLQSAADLLAVDEVPAW